MANNNENVNENNKKSSLIGIVFMVLFLLIVILVLIFGQPVRYFGRRGFFSGPRPLFGINLF